jgi:hypothetical protein
MLKCEPVINTAFNKLTSHCCYPCWALRATVTRMDSIAHATNTGLGKECVEQSLQALDEWGRDPVYSVTTF